METKENLIIGKVHDGVEVAIPFYITNLIPAVSEMSILSFGFLGLILKSFK